MGAGGWHAPRVKPGVTDADQADQRGSERLSGWTRVMIGRAPRKSLGSGFPLQVRALITGLAGFPLQSVTRQILQPFS